MIKALSLVRYKKSSNLLLPNKIPKTMQTQVTKKIDFKGKDLYIGLVSCQHSYDG